MIRHPARITLVILLLFFCAYTAMAQRIKHNKILGQDIIKLKKGKYLMTGKEILFQADRDTVIQLEHDNRHKIRRNSKSFLQRRFVKDLVSTITTSDTSTQEVIVVSNIRSEAPFMPYNGKTIASIRIKKVDVFTGSVIDTASYERTPWLERIGNTLHMNTRDWVIHNNILFDQGEPLDPYKMADNERILRSLPFIRDAKIYIIPRKDNHQIVDVVVVTQDVFAFGVKAEANGFTSLLLGAYNSNLLGTAQYLEVDGLYDINRNPNVGTSIIHRYENWFGSYINTELKYNNINDGLKYGAGYESGNSIKISRRFVTPQIKFAGGLEAGNNVSIDVYNNPRFQKYEYNVFDIWLGRAFAIKEYDNKGLQNRSRIILAGRYTNLAYQRRPLVGIDSLQSYLSYQRYLASLSFSRRKYYKTNYVYGFGRTEDIPYGGLIEATVGLENDDLANRLYLGFRISKAIIPSKIGYFHFQAGIGGYFKKNLFEQGVFKTGTYFFTNLIKMGKLRLRQFISAQYTLGINRNVYERVNLNNENGIKGFSSGLTNGTQKFSINLESTIYTPLNIYGFRPAFYLFADIGAVTTGTDIQLLSDKLYTGIGVGVRIRNERLVFKTIQFGIAYYPLAPPDMRDFAYGVSFGETRPALDDFEGKAPSIITYK